MAVTYPAPIFSQPTSVTFAALTIASAASIMATSPLVSTIPNASPMFFLFFGGLQNVFGAPRNFSGSRTTPGLPRQPTTDGPRCPGPEIRGSVPQVLHG